MQIQLNQPLKNMIGSKLLDVFGSIVVVNYIDKHDQNAP